MSEILTMLCLTVLPVLFIAGSVLFRVKAGSFASAGRLVKMGRGVHILSLFSAVLIALPIWTMTINAVFSGEGYHVREDAYLGAFGPLALLGAVSIPFFVLFFCVFLFAQHRKATIKSKDMLMHALAIGALFSAVPGLIYVTNAF